MEAAQTHCYVKVYIQFLSAKLHIVEEVEDSCGGEAQQEDDKDQRAGLDVHHPVEVGSVELADDPDVAEDGDQQWQQEAEDGEDQVVVEQERVGVEPHREDIMAGGEFQVRETVGLLDEELGDDGGPEHHPHGQGHPGGAHPLRQGFVPEGVHHGQVALDADAGQRLGRAVQVAIETGRDNSAGSLSESPVVSMEMVVSLEEEGEEEEEVGDGQAEVQDGRGHLPDLGGQRAQDGDVGRDAHGDHQHVNDGDEPGADRALQVLGCVVVL